MIAAAAGTAIGTILNSVPVKLIFHDGARNVYEINQINKKAAGANWFQNLFNLPVPYDEARHSTCSGSRSTDMFYDLRTKTIGGGSYFRPAFEPLPGWFD
ncbi:MAG: hypothetical protein AB7G06_07535 [Bdellovibrionales bacterium]